jgi:hypothetical protein
VASANTAAATSSAYSAGVAAGAAAATVPPATPVAPVVVAPASGSWVMGMSYATLPAGSMSISKNGNTYYLNGNTWFQPAYGANGVYYKVVPTP